jgi:predicted nucleotidyltransferase
MSVIIKSTSNFDLTKISRNQLISEFNSKLKGRVHSGYFFGSFARNEVNSNSDIDILLIVENPSGNIVERSKHFSDLWDIFPAIDLLVYSLDEFELKNKTETQGFWPMMKNELLQFI